MQQIRGLRLFDSEQFECFRCHQGVDVTIAYRDAATTPGTIVVPFRFLQVRSARWKLGSSGWTLNDGAAGRRRHAG
ncbi:MAG: hypothetical protein FJ144_26170 [Deltaproteobacteria bacterium]|nr:hypothetical protein [Deltaproteobacteria bacterium]